MGFFAELALKSAVISSRCINRHKPIRGLNYHNIVLMTKMSVPESNAIKNLLKNVYCELSSLSEGDVADYIPELAKADSSDFGIVVAMANGNIYEIGNTSKEFTIQSISKPFAYGFALQDLGEEYMRGKVGVEPSGEAFNAISLDPETGMPRNPMINAGAIATTSQIQHLKSSNAEAALISYFSRLAGRDLSIDSSVYMSERDTGHRNRAISHLLKNVNVIEGDTEAGLDLYFRQCSIKVNCRDLAVMASTLCCQGVNPVTHDAILRSDVTVQMLSLMGTCGMYDYAGQWLHDVGMPAKSGVGGGILAVVPGKLGIAVYSPPLDRYGNSVRGVAACTKLSSLLGLHLYNSYPSAKGVIRRLSDSSCCNSRRLYNSTSLNLLHQYGSKLKIVNLQGYFEFAQVEEVSSFLSDAGRSAEIVLFDFKYVEGFSEEALEILIKELSLWESAELILVLSSVDHLSALISRIEGGSIQYSSNFDSALEIAETFLLRKYDSSFGNMDHIAQFEIFPEFAGMKLDSLLESVQVIKGEKIVQSGDIGDSMYFVKSGRFSTYVEVDLGDHKKYSSRLATFTVGMFFGEIGFLSGHQRTADVVAEEQGLLLKLSRSNFDKLTMQEPSIAQKFLSYLSSALGSRLARTSYQLTVMDHL